MKKPAARTLLLAAMTSVLAACANVPPNIPPGGGSLVPNEGKIQVTEDVSIGYQELVWGAATYWSMDGILEKPLDQLRFFQYPIMLYFVYQPFAPNWTVEEAKLSDDVYYVRLQAKRFRTGGDGEAMLVMKRRATQLQHERGYAGYRILDYSEGIQSSTPISQRYSEGVFKLVRADAPPR